VRTGPAAILALLGAITVTALLAGSSSADLSSRYRTGKQRAGQLQTEIEADSTRIQGFDGSIGDLEQRLGEIQRSINVQERQLSSVRTSLDRARTRLTGLQAQYERGRRILAAALVARYESPPPTVMNVVVDAQGFDDLLNRVNDLRTVQRHNTETVLAVKRARRAVTTQAERLATIEARKQRAVTSVLTERDDVAQLRLSIVRRRLAYVDARSRKAAELTSLRKTLSREATVLDREAAAAVRAAGAGAAPSGGAPVPSGLCANTPFVAHGGSYGFFPAAGTDYSVNQEPIIAARLDQLGRALQLHLVGISGYRSPQHSVEVGGFSDDPHTQGRASDTPGVEGVAEATLNRFCLTRPFGGAREADHIQEN
jgi:peptidoglycan hydrolase CwlO-like protein